MTDVAPGTAGTVEARWPVDVLRGIPLALALVALVWIAADDGGFEATTWYPAALLVTAVLAVTTWRSLTRRSAAPHSLRPLRSAGSRCGRTRRSCGPTTAARRGTART